MENQKGDMLNLVNLLMTYGFQGQGPFKYMYDLLRLIIDFTYIYLQYWWKHRCFTKGS